MDLGGATERIGDKHIVLTYEILKDSIKTSH